MRQEKRSRRRPFRQDPASGVAAQLQRTSGFQSNANLNFATSDRYPL
jgi:hypothetical protein